MAIKKFNKNMFESLKESLKKEPPNSSGGNFDNIMKFPAGNTYRIRLIPNVENVEDTFFHHYVNSWTSNSTGKYVSALSLKSFNESDPIANAKWKLYNEWKKANPNPVDEKGEKIKFDNPITEKEQWLVNAYWVDNPSDPTKNGTVQILRFGPQIKKIIDNAIDGDGQEEFGYGIFDLGEDGCDLLVVSAKKGEYTTYESSRFTTKSKLRLSEDEIEKVYEQVYNLKEVYTVKTADELTAMLDEHFYCVAESKKEVKKSTPPQKQQRSAPPEEDDDEPPFEDDEDIPMSHPGDSARKLGETPEDTRVEEMLKELNLKK